MNAGTVGRSYAVGDVGSGYAPGEIEIGGLVGLNNIGSVVQTSFANTTVNGGNKGFGPAGGLVGANAGTVTNSYALGTVHGVNNGFQTGGLIGYNSHSLSTSYAAAAVFGISTGPLGGVGGLIGTGNPPESSSYWDIEASGQSTSAGGTPLTTNQLQSGTLPTGFDPNVWSAKAGQYPTLTGVGGQQQLSTTTLNLGTLPIRENVNIPISALPPPTDIFGNLMSFHSQYGSLLPESTQSYFNTKIAQSTPMLASDPKLRAANQVQNLTYTTLLLDLGTFAAQRNPGNATMLLSDIAGLNALPRDSSPLAEASSFLYIFGNLSLTAATCGSAVLSGGTAIPADIACGVSVIGSIISTWIIPHQQILAEIDPPDLDFGNVFVPPTSIPLVQINTSNAAFNNIATETATKLEEASAYLLSLVVSINRYSSAYEANDASSAVLQLEAILHYLSLYENSLQAASVKFRSLTSMIELQQLFQTPYSFVDFLSFQSGLSESGLTVEEITFLDNLGFPMTSIEELLQIILGTDPLSLINARDTIEENLSQIGIFLSPRVTDIPEPSSMSVIISCIVVTVILFMRHRRYRV